ncbi:hypothetical protein [Wenyingzhuangia sp. IMCC45467]
MLNSTFEIEIIEIGWYNGEKSAPYDRCAHGYLKVIIGTEIVVKPDLWLNISASGLHLLRTLESNHTKENQLFRILLPTDGHHLNHLPEDECVTIETEMDNGYNWWIEHDNSYVNLTTESNTITKIKIEEYSEQIIQFINKIEEFFSKDIKKTIPESEYDHKGYLMFKKEWRKTKNKFEKV